MIISHHQHGSFTINMVINKGLGLMMVPWLMMVTMVHMCEIISGSRRWFIGIGTTYDGLMVLDGGCWHQPMCDGSTAVVTSGRPT